MRRSLLLLGALACSGVSPVHQHRLELKTDFIAQQTPSWCWAATASMALNTLGFPDINEVKNYQCGVVAVAFPRCEDDCTQCDSTLDTMFSFVNLLNRYRDVTMTARPTARQRSFSAYYVAYPKLDQVRSSLDHSYPVIAGVSLNLRPRDPATPQHAVLITGYDLDAKGREASIILHDPYPYERGENPWVVAGLSYEQETGRVTVPWRVLRTQMNLTSAVFLHKLGA